MKRAWIIDALTNKRGWIDHKISQTKHIIFGVYQWQLMKKLVIEEYVIVFFPLKEEVFTYFFENIQVCKKEIIMNRGELNVNEARELLKRFRVKVSLSTKYITHVHIIQFQGWISRSELPRLWRSVELLIIKLPIVYKHAKFHLDYVTLNKERSAFPCLYSIMLPSWS